MADKPDKPAQVRKVTITDAGIAPFLFFEGAPNFGFRSGVVNVTLVAARHIIKEGAASSDIVAVAYLRCTIPAAIELRNALDSALLLATKTEGKTN